jgi:hypothetical protein
MSEQSIAAELLAALEMVVLERQAGGELRLIGRAPEWFQRLCPGAAASPDSLNQAIAFSFFDNFLVDAEGFWLSNGAGRLKSGLWTETDSLGNEVHLEVSAVCLGAKKILLVENQTLAQEEKQSLLQKARASKLRERERKRPEERGSR